MHVTGWSTALVFSIPLEFTFYAGKQLHASVVIWLQGGNNKFLWAWQFVALFYYCFILSPVKS